MSYLKTYYRRRNNKGFCNETNFNNENKFAFLKQRKDDVNPFKAMYIITLDL